MPEQPLAYFLTFTTYGTWLHGDERGSVDREHNQPDTPWLELNSQEHRAARERMTQTPYVLDTVRRATVRDAIVEECCFRHWTLLALHVRSNHVHLVVVADCKPEYVLRNCKAHASQCLHRANLDSAARKRWTTHGSTKYLWQAEAVLASVAYTLHRQGEPMGCHEGEWQTFVLQNS